MRTRYHSRDGLAGYGHARGCDRPRGPGARLMPATPTPYSGLKAGWRPPGRSPTCFQPAGRPPGRPATSAVTRHPAFRKVDSLGQEEIARPLVTPGGATPARSEEWLGDATGPWPAPPARRGFMMPIGSSLCHARLAGWPSTEAARGSGGRPAALGSMTAASAGLIARQRRGPWRGVLRARRSAPVLRLPPGWDARCRATAPRS